jgi:peroxiredoxin
MKKMLAPLLILLLVSLFAVDATALETGAVAPDFELPTLEGKRVRLSDYKGQIIVLKLATTWCPTCKQQSQEIRDIDGALRDRNVAYVEVFLQDSEKMVREYLQGEKLTMPHVALMDDGTALKAYNVYLIPRLLVIDQDFKVRRDGSLVPSRELIMEIEKAAAGKK